VPGGGRGPIRNLKREGSNGVKIFERQGGAEFRMENWGVDGLGNFGNPHY